MDSEKVLSSISKNSKKTTRNEEVKLTRVRLLSDPIANNLQPAQATLPEEYETQRMIEPSRTQTCYHSPFYETDEHLLIPESRQMIDPEIIASIETTCSYKSTETPSKNPMAYNTLENPIMKHFLRFVLPILVANLVTFVISQLIYHFVLGKQGKDIFELLAEYLYKTASNLNQFWFFSIWIGQYLSRKNPITNVIPETIHMVVNFEGALALHEPNRHEKVKLFSKHVLLMWLLSIRQFSQRMQEMYPDNKTIQQELDLTVDELKDLEDQPAGGLFIFRWLLATITEAEFNNHFRSPADAKAMKQDVLAFRRNCENAAKFASGRIIPNGFLRLSYFAVHVYGWLSVLGYKGEIGNSPFHFPSQNFFAYVLSLVWFEFCRSIAHPFDDEKARDTVQIFQEKLFDHKTFLEEYLSRFKVFNWTK